MALLSEDVPVHHIKHPTRGIKRITNPYIKRSRILSPLSATKASQRAERQIRLSGKENSSHIIYI